MFTEYVLLGVIACVLLFIIVMTNIIDAIAFEEYMEEIEDDDIDAVYVIYR